MLLWYLLLVLVPVGGVYYLVWDHKRKAAERAAASAGRLQEILGAVRESPRGAEPVAGPSTPAPSAPATPSYTARDRFLPPPHALVYFLLRTGLPDYLVFAHVALDTVLEAAAGLSAYARNEHMRRLVRHTIDFVVTDKSMRPVAVVELAPQAPEPQDEALAARRSWLASAGLRYVALEPRALPRKEALRALVLGEPAVDGTPAATAGRAN